MIEQEAVAVKSPRPPYHSPVRPGALALVLAAAVLFTGCPPTMVNIPEPNAFARNIFKIAEEGSAAEWGTQLTEARRAMGKPYINKHFESWRTLLLQLKQTFGEPVEKVPFRVEGNGLEFQFNNKWNLLFRVATEDGGLKINQD